MRRRLPRWMVEAWLHEMVIDPLEPEEGGPALRYSAYPETLLAFDESGFLSGGLIGIREPTVESHVVAGGHGFSSGWSASCAGSLRDSGPTASTGGS